MVEKPQNMGRDLLWLAESYCSIDRLLEITMKGIKRFIVLWNCNEMRVLPRMKVCTWSGY